MINVFLIIGPIVKILVNLNWEMILNCKLYSKTQKII